MRLVEVALFTENVAAAAGFYRKLLGREPVHQAAGIAIFQLERPPTGGREPTVCSPAAWRPAAKLLIHEKYAAQEGELPAEDHFAFAVDDLDAAVAAFEAQGGRVEFPPRTYDWGRSAYLRDPDGRLVELHEDR